MKPEAHGQTVGETHAALSLHAGQHPVQKPVLVVAVPLEHPEGHHGYVCASERGFLGQVFPDDRALAAPARFKRPRIDGGQEKVAQREHGRPPHAAAAFPGS